MPLLPCGCEKVFAVRIESLWEEAVRLLPLLRVEVRPDDVDTQVLALSDSNASELNLLLSLITKRANSRRIHAQTLFYNVREVLQFRYFFIGNYAWISCSPGSSF